MDDMLARDAAVFFHQHGSSPCMATLVKAEGLWLTDDQGRRFMDFHGNTAHHIGHAHPRLVAALKAQMDQLAFSPRRFANDVSTELAENLTRRFRGGQSRLLLTRGGSEAIETAIRLARISTRRSGVIAFEGSYHGHGLGSLGLSSAHLDERLGSQVPDIFHIAPYWKETGATASLAALEQVLVQHQNKIACFVAEPMRSNCHVPPSDFWSDVSSLCSKAGVKLIFDEIASGLGKTGRFFAHEHFGVEPDLVVLGKALGGGMLPVAAVIGDEALNVAPELKVGHFTHEKNPLLARAALTTLQIIDDENLVERADEAGRFLEQRIAALATNGLPIAIRGLGLFRALEINDAKLSARDLTTKLLNFEISCDAKDAHSIGFSPPLTITHDEIEYALAQIVQCLGQ
jgi:4-aminobutyrate aminotransferase